MKKSVLRTLVSFLSAFMVAGLATPLASASSLPPGEREVVTVPDITPPQVSFSEPGTRSPINTMRFDRAIKGAHAWGTSWLETSNHRRYINGRIKDTDGDSRYAAMQMWFVAGKEVFDPKLHPYRIIRYNEPNTEGHNAGYTKEFNYNTGIDGPASIWIRACRKNTLVLECGTLQRMRMWN